jgi:hypothetical protein
MERRNVVWCLVGIVAGLGLSCGIRGGRNQPSHGREAAAQAAPGAADLLQQAREAQQARQRVVQELARLLAEPPPAGQPPGQAVEAMHLLGDPHLSTPEAVNAVLRHLYELDKTAIPKASTVYPDPDKMWPAFGALAKIGLPAIPALVEEIRTQRDKDKRYRCAFFLNLIVGEHAKSWLTQALQQAEDRTAKARLEEALKYSFYGSGAYDSSTWFFRPQKTGPWYKPSQ